jgi:hypothetical protein
MPRCPLALLILLTIGTQAAQAGDISRMKAKPSGTQFGQDISPWTVTHGGGNSRYRAAPAGSFGMSVRPTITVRPSIGAMRLR